MTRDINSVLTVLITRNSNPSYSKFSRSCNNFTSIWSMFTCKTYNKKVERKHKPLTASI